MSTKNQNFVYLFIFSSFQIDFEVKVKGKKEKGKEGGGIKQREALFGLKIKVLTMMKNKKKIKRKKGEETMKDMNEITEIFFPNIDKNPKKSSKTVII